MLSTRFNNLHIVARRKQIFGNFRLCRPKNFKMLVLKAKNGFPFKNLRTLSQLFCSKFSSKSLRTEKQFDDLRVENIGQWVKLTDDAYKTMNFDVTLPKKMRQNADTFGESCFMVRRPYLDLVNCLRQSSNLDTPVVRYVLYGRHGCGKTTTLNQIAYWAHSQGWVVVYVDNPGEWCRAWQWTIKSTWNASRIDLPTLATKFLINFKRTNEYLLQGLTTSKTYEWAPKETTHEGEPLMNVVEHGIARPKTASDCFSVLLKELQQYASRNKIKVLVAVDIANALFGLSRIFKEKKRYAEMDDITIIRSLREMFKFNWSHGAVVLTVDSREIREHLPNSPPNSHLPYYLLGKEGFDHLEPFLPVEIPDYTDEEAQSVLDYYIDRHWLTTPPAQSEEGQKQIKLFSNRNPRLLDRFCAPM